MSGPSYDDYRRYLEQKYGSDEGFTHLGPGNCPFFDADFCVRLFTSKYSARPFQVRYNKYTSPHYTDQYWIAKNEPELAEFFANYFNTYIPYKYSLYFVGKTSDPKDYTKDASGILASSSVRLSIDIKTKYEDVPDLSNIDIAELRAHTLKVVKNVPKAIIGDVELEIDMTGANLKGTCPNNMGTYLTTGNIISKCTVTLRHLHDS